MKNRDNKRVNRNTVERDLKALFRMGDCLPPRATEKVFDDAMNLQRAKRLFDEAQTSRTKAARRRHDPKWTHPSVFTLDDPDPISAITLRARNMVLDAIQRGWSGPPYNPFTLAEMRGIKLLPTDRVIDARTYSDHKQQFTIEYNPQRTAARMRYSIAHELGHTLFPDCAKKVRNRATHQEMTADDWQLESLCNIAAAEILMPFGMLADQLSVRPNAGLVLELRRTYVASCEAVVNRLIRLTSYPCVAFFARLSAESSKYFVEYQIPSPSLDEGLSIHRGYTLPQSSKASTCTAIGARDQEDVGWISSGKQWFVEYLGISPYTGETYPRVLALAFPPLAPDFKAAEPFKSLRGDASEPFGAEPKLLLQVVNDKASVWGGGFAKYAGRKWPQAQRRFREWVLEGRQLRLGNIHSVSVRDDLTLVSLVAQHGFKPAAGPRLRYGALSSALEKVAYLAIQKGATVHMPRIGTGEAGGDWKIIEGIVQETLTARGIRVTVYYLHQGEDESARQPPLDFSEKMADELI
jgi:Zn-dependent peptidase ImmA (M78 family)/O-acetyl-ADP-ribose deacetylase (regulator of RNase III)